MTKLPETVLTCDDVMDSITSGRGNIARTALTLRVASVDDED